MQRFFILPAVESSGGCCCVALLYSIKTISIPTPYPQAIQNLFYKLETFTFLRYQRFLKIPIIDDKNIIYKAGTNKNEGALHPHHKYRIVKKAIAS